MTGSDTEAAAAPPQPGLGQRLVLARERRGLGVVQAAEKLHLEPRVIEALEAENFEVLGAAVYVRGHLQRYADLLGENAAELHALYASLEHARATPDLTQVITERNRGMAPGARVGVWQGGLLTLALVMAALVWWAVRSGPVAPPTTAPGPPPQEPAAGAVAAPGAAPVAQRDLPARVAARARDDATVPRTARPAAAAPTVAPTLPATAAEGPAAGAAPAATAPVAKAPVAVTPPLPAANAARVVLSFREDSWAEVYDANGTALYRDIAAAGAVHELSGAPPLRLVLGNAAGVGITVNGRNVSLGAALQATPNAQFALDRGGRVTELP